ncbi:MAG: hypothetical protein JWR60_3592 [Polaromonas sp.]|nr:hypothetical protein [Polaromonas sp.]
MQLSCVTLGFFASIAIRLHYYRKLQPDGWNLIFLLFPLIKIMRPDIAPPFRDAPAAAAAALPALPAVSVAADALPAAASGGGGGGGGFSVLAWPAWLRLLAVLPAVVLLWLGVLWAQAEAAPW